MVTIDLMLISLRINEIEMPTARERAIPDFHSIPDVPIMKVSASVLIEKIKNLKIRLILGSSLKIR